MEVGQEVQVVNANYSAYPWKRQLVGAKGRVDEATETAVAVRFTDGTWQTMLHPVWFAKESVEVCD